MSLHEPDGSGSPITLPAALDDSPGISPLDLPGEGHGDEDGGKAAAAAVVPRKRGRPQVVNLDDYKDEIVHMFAEGASMRRSYEDYEKGHAGYANDVLM